MTAPRRYSEAELRTLFERAAERQEQARRAEEASRSGLTLAELQEIGAASGIDPAHVAAVAAEMAAPHASGGEGFGGMADVRRTRHLAAPVTDEVWEATVEDLRRTFGSAGMAGSVGRRREWTTSTDEDKMPVRVSVLPEGEGARVTIEQSLRTSARGLTAAAATLAVLALVLGVILAVAEGTAALIFPAIFAGVAVLMFGGGRLGLRWYADRQASHFESALDRLELIARDAAPVSERVPHREAEGAPPAEEGARSAEGRLSLDSLPRPSEALPDEAGGRGPGVRSRTRS